MKKNLFIPVMAYALVSFLCVGCNTEDVYDPESNRKEKEYANAFVKEFGKIDPNHTWGFGEAATRWANPNANQWGNEYVVPSPVNSEITNEIEIVKNWFQSNQNPVSTGIDWSNYFAQQVSSNQNAKKMNNIHCYSADKTQKDHLSNFNVGGDQAVNNNVWNGELTNQSDPNAKKTYSDKIILMIDSYTSYFSYQESTDSKDIFNFVIIPGATIDPSLASYYYLGFDYETTNGNIPADGYYDDWIIRLTPAVKIESRIICEDLGSIGDFDFNDAVIDICTVNNNSTAITIQAAGGTLPLYIQVGNEPAFEIHEKLGVSTSTLVNTGEGERIEPVTITYNKIYTANDVNISVGGIDARYTLHAPTGKAPQKICVTGDFSWPAERQSIKEKYPNFTKYVENQDTSWY